MIDINLIRENPESIIQNMQKKGVSKSKKIIKDILAKDEEWKKFLQEEQDLRASRNVITKKIAESKKKKENVDSLLQEAKEIPAKIKTVQEMQEKIKDEVNNLLSLVPNMMHPDVPIGKDDSENPTIKEVGKKKNFDFEVLNHVDLCEKLDLVDFEAARQVSGNGFYYLKGNLALLNQALIQFTINFMREKKYLYVETPLMIHREILDAAMDAEGFEQSIYSLCEDDLHMIGTSEHSILGMLGGRVIDVPQKVFSYSMCFRKEIGSHGINEKGLWRTHQFNKIEQFIFCKPSESWKYFDELLANSEEILKKLELPYRVIECCTGDLSAWKARSFDLEVWRPTTKSYGEVMSLSNCTDYQARGLGIRFEENGKREYVHTLNNTAMATSRILVAILENYQNKDGSVTVPKVLQPYIGVKKL